MLVGKRDPEETLSLSSSDGLGGISSTLCFEGYDEEPVLVLSPLSEVSGTPEREGFVRTTGLLFPTDEELVLLQGILPSFLAGKRCTIPGLAFRLRGSKAAP